MADDNTPDRSIDLNIYLQEIDYEKINDVVIKSIIFPPLYPEKFSTLKSNKECSDFFADYHKKISNVLETKYNKLYQEYKHQLNEIANFFISDYDQKNAYIHRPNKQYIKYSNIIKKIIKDSDS